MLCIGKQKNIREGCDNLNTFIDNLIKESSGFLDHVAEKTNQYISLAGGDPEIGEILSYSIQTKGHMLRPLLVYLTAQAIAEEQIQKEYEKLTCFAAAVELLHNASLIHDDMLDNEELRRGKECLYKKYGYRNAILAGNCYYIKSLEVSNTYLTQQLTGEILQAAYNMCLGEMMQAKYENQSIPTEEYFSIIKAKTAALTKLACKGTAEILGSIHQEQWGQIGELIGFIYQMKDDIKDHDLNLSSGISLEQYIASALSEIEGVFLQTQCSTKQQNILDLIRMF